MLLILTGHIRSKRGITFLEMMIVIVILGTLLSVAAPRMKNFHQQGELKGAAREIASLCRFARAKAIMSEKKVEVYFDVDMDKFWVSFEPEESDATKYNSKRSREELKSQIEDLKTLPKFIIFEEISSDAPDFKKKSSLVRIVYYPNGSATSAYIVLKNKNDKRMTIEIPRATGFPEVYDGLPSDIQDRINAINSSPDSASE